MFKRLRDLIIQGKTHEILCNKAVLAYINDYKKAFLANTGTLP